MTDFDPEEFLNRPIYAFDFQVMIGDIRGFLEFSENNIDWQYRAELQSLRRQSEIKDIPDVYYDHLVENAKHWFEVSLPMWTRYAALVAQTTTVEWAAKFLAERASFSIGKRPKDTNKTVHILRRFNKRLSLGRESEIEDYSRLVIARNAIVHSAGIERDYQFRDELEAAIDALRGFSISRWHFFGECVTIDRAALEPYIDAMASMLPEMYEQADKQGLLSK